MENMKAQEAKLKDLADEAERALGKLREFSEHSQRSRAEEAGEAQVALAALETRAAAAERNVQQLTERIAGYETRIVKLEFDVGEKQASLKRLTDQVQDLTKDKSTLEVFVGQARDREEAAALAQNDLDLARLDLDLARAQLKKEQGELQRTVSEREGAETQLDGINAQIKDAEAAAEGLDEKTRAEVLVHQKARMAREQELERLRVRQEQLQFEVTRLADRAMRKRELMDEQQRLCKRLCVISEELEQDELAGEGIAEGLDQDEQAGEGRQTSAGQAPAPTTPNRPTTICVQHFLETPEAMRGALINPPHTLHVESADAFDSISLQRPRSLFADDGGRSARGREPSSSSSSFSADREEEEEKANELAERLGDCMNVDEQNHGPVGGRRDGGPESDVFESASTTSSARTRLDNDAYLDLADGMKIRIRAALLLVEKKTGSLPAHDIRDPLTHTEIDNLWDNGYILDSVQRIYMSDESQSFKDGNGGRGVNKMAVAVYVLNQWCKTNHNRCASRREAQELLASAKFMGNLAKFETYSKAASKKKKKAGNK
jgi:hypothetical protein